MTPHARCMRWHWCQMNDAFGVIDTTWTVHAVSLTPHAKYDTVCTIAERFGRSWQTWKGISIKMFANWPTPPIQKYINLRGLLNKKKFVHAVSWKWAIKKSNIFANWKQNTKALAYELGAQVALFDEKKTEDRKSRDIVPLRAFLFAMIVFMDLKLRRYIDNVYQFWENTCVKQRLHFYFVWSWSTGCVCAQ
jgi:hypothetical protein